MAKRSRRKYPLRPLSFRARVFVALVGISATTSFVVGLVLYYFAQDGLLAEERDVRLIVRDDAEHIVGLDGRRKAFSVPQCRDGFVDAAALRHDCP